MTPKHRLFAGLGLLVATALTVAAIPQKPRDRYHAFLSEPMTRLSSRTGTTYVEQEQVTEMLNDLVGRGHAIDSILHVPETLEGRNGELQNRVLVITRQ